MATTPLKARVRFQPGVAIMDLQGEVTVTDEDVLNTAYADASSHNPGAIILNFSDVKFIDTTGIALIVGLLAQARKARRCLLVCGLSAHYVEIFQITRLADFMTLFPDETSALAGASTVEPNPIT